MHNIIFVLCILCLNVINLSICRPKPKLTAEDVEKIEALPIDKILPVDHLEGIRLEQDGMLNKDFHKEAFLGNHEEIDDEPVQIADSKLKDIFHKVDTDADGHMNLIEMESWINEKIQQHFDEAMEEHSHIFKHMDPDGDGLIDWKEYYKHFLMAKKYDMNVINNYLKDYGEDVMELKEADREQLVRYKFKWTDVEQMPLDNKLNKDEFLAFRHPEQSPMALNKMIETILNSLDFQVLSSNGTFDENNDGSLTIKEFIALPPGEVEDEEQKKMDEKWQDDRAKEFRNMIDKDQDGVVTRDELIKYVDPRNKDQTKAEAENLLQMLDDNKDGKVSMDEMLNHKDVFIDSKVVNVKKSLHDEF